jgi:hypothetical protein
MLDWLYYITMDPARKMTQELTYPELCKQLNKLLRAVYEKDSDAIERWRLSHPEWDPEFMRPKLGLEL